MSVDVVLTGRVFLDLTFEGLERLPEPGRERYARDLHATPGGDGITAIGLARLGLRAAVLTELGGDVPGRMLRELLEREGVLCAGGDGGATPVTVVVPLDGERAMITHEPPLRADLGALAALEPRAVVCGPEQLASLPPGPLAYTNVGDQSSERFAVAPPRGLDRARALFANRSEAARMTGEATPEAAALALGELVETAVVSCGAEGAVAASGGEIFSAPAPPVEARDTTGAGDLLAAAYIWGDLNGLPLDERLRRAAVFAALSVRTATGAGGAATRDELEHALAELDPGMVQAGSDKEGR